MSTISDDTPALKVEQYWNGGILVVSVEGRVNSLNSPDFQHKLEAALNKESKSVILDCEQLSYISSAGLRVILITAKEPASSGVEVRRLLFGTGRQGHLFYDRVRPRRSGSRLVEQRR